MKRHTPISRQIAAFSLAAVSCAAMMLAPMDGTAAPFPQYAITASASSNNRSQDTVILKTGKQASVSTGASKTWDSKNKKYRLTLNGNGTLVLTEKSSGRKLWTSGNGVGSSPKRTFSLKMQADGNLVLYGKPVNSTKQTAIWNSQTVTAGSGNTFSLYLSNQGELYIYHDQINQSIWSSRSEIECTASSNTVLYASQCISSKNRFYRAVMQADGNFVIYNRGNGVEKPLWHTNTYGNNGAFFALQQDGNLVVYSSAHKPLYHSGTGRSPYASYRFALGDDGILTLYRKSDGYKIWTSKDGDCTGKAKVESMLNWAVNIANDDSHGYSQTNRLGPDYDCSSLVCSAAHQAGFNVSPSLNTRTMKDPFVSAGFEWIPWAKIGGPDKLQRGDIVLKIYNDANGYGHTVLYLGDNKVVAAVGIRRSDGTLRPKSEQICVHDFNNNKAWDGVLRYKG